VSARFPATPGRAPVLLVQRTQSTSSSACRIYGIAVASVPQRGGVVGSAAKRLAGPTRA